MEIHYVPMLTPTRSRCSITQLLNLLYQKQVPLCTYHHEIQSRYHEIQSRYALGQRKHTIRHSEAAPSLMCVKHPWVRSAQHALTPLTRGGRGGEIGTSSMESEQSPVGVCKPKATLTHGPRPFSSRRGTKALIHQFLGKYKLSFLDIL